MKYQFLRFPEGRTKAVTLSYDDGHTTDKKLTEIINKYGLKCTYNLVGLKVEKEHGLAHDFIKKEILDNGHEVANHGYNHRAQNKIRSIEGIREIIDCRLALENIFGIPIRGFAYPDNSVNRFTEPDTYKRIKSYLNEIGISYARNAGSDNDKFLLPEDFHNWMPTAHHDNPDIIGYIDKFLNLDISKLYISNRDPKLFYLWGHTRELERNNNWNHFDTICQKLSGKSDIWYATNIEIYDYVNAYNSLIYSADGRIVYNPTLYTIWFDVDGKLYSIKSGETLHLQDS